MKNLQVGKLAVDILVDIVGGILIAVGTYNFAATAEFPMVGFNGIGLILYHLFGLPIGTVAFVLNIPVAICCFKILGERFFHSFHPHDYHYISDHGLRGASVSGIRRET